MTYKYDIGVYIVPKHVFEGQDWTTFKHFDLAKKWPVTTGPWQVVDASLQQKVFDRRPTWWAAGGRAQHQSAFRRRTAGGAGADHERAR